MLYSTSFFETSGGWSVVHTGGGAADDLTSIRIDVVDLASIRTDADVEAEAPGV
jgi:hypothetical protein